MFSMLKVKMMQSDFTWLFMDLYGSYCMYMYYTRIEDMVYVFYIHVLEDPFLRIFFLVSWRGGGVEGRWVDESNICTSSIDAGFGKQMN